MTIAGTEMNGKLCLITGANSGIGKATALALAKMGAFVVMVCRDERKGELARQEIQRASGNPCVELMVADLSSQAEVRRLAAEYQDRYARLHVLINNAGVLLDRFHPTVDGIEATFAINYLAPFLLTNLLLDTLKASAPARIINVSSLAHRGGHIDFPELHGAWHNKGFPAYNQSKLALVLFTYELARRLEGTGVTVNALHPGIVGTNFASEEGNLSGIFFMLARPFLLSSERGARTSIYLASSPEVEGVSGKYFVKCKPVRSSRESYNPGIAARLWEISAALTGLDVPAVR